MKKPRLILCFLLSLSFVFPSLAEEAAPLDTQKQIESMSGEAMIVAKRKKKRNRRKKTRLSKRFNERKELLDALGMAKKGEYQEASLLLYKLSHSPRYRSRRMQIKYILGLMMYQMKFYQVAAFQFITVVKDGNSKYIRQSLEKLSLAADALGDDTLLNYAISRVKVNQFPAEHRDMLFYRIGEFQMRTQQFAAAAKSLERVREGSEFFSKAKYLQGLSYAEMKRNKQAISSFDDLIDARAGLSVTDKTRVAALIGKARVYYQNKNWDTALDYYRRIPRDTEFWHDTLFESSWAMLRSGRFRSALSNFQSLHSAFYEDFYLPESLLLRSIVYLYICKYDEMDKVLKLYNKIYKPVYTDIKKYLDNEKNPVAYFNDVVRVLRDFKRLGDDIDRNKYRVPFLVTRKVIREGDFQRTYEYIKSLLLEKERYRKMPPKWRDAAIGKYTKRVLNTRMLKARKKAGKQIRAHMIEVKNELVDLSEQEGFIRYEMINGKKELLKKKVAGKELGEVETVEKKRDREFYVKNGYEYWPFQGEYWLDELGNYHYVGTQSCH